MKDRCFIRHFVLAAVKQLQEQAAQGREGVAGRAMEWSEAAGRMQELLKAAGDALAAGGKAEQQLAALCEYVESWPR